MTLIMEIKNDKLPKVSLVNLVFKANLVRNNISRELRNYNLSFPQYNVLRILRGQNGECISIRGIRDKMICENSNASRVVEKLLLKKLLSKEQSKKSKREVNICITKKGMDLLKELDDLILNTERKIFKELRDQEMIDFNELLKKIN